MNFLRRLVAARSRGDGGLSLVDLLVTAALTVLLLPLVGVLVHSAVESERDVHLVTEAGTAARTAVTSIEAGVRNAAGFQRPARSPDDLNDFLVVRTRDSASGDPTWSCRAWFYDAATKTLYTRMVPATGTTPVLSEPSAATLDGWLQLATGVTPGAGGRLFTTNPHDRTRLDVDLSVAAGPSRSRSLTTGSTRPPVTISTSVIRRPQGTSDGAPCF